MRQFIRNALLCACAFALAGAASAQDPFARKELKRTDVTGAPGMEVISSMTEIKPGEGVPLHSHHGVEMVYVLQGAMIQAPGKDPRMLPTGADLLNLRDVPHAGFKVVGDTSLKIYTVHIVDKGKPLFEVVQ